MTRVQYSYWTGSNWVPQYIEVDPPMKTGWHILNVVLGLMTGVWFVGYGVLYWSCYIDYKRRVQEAEKAIQDYYASLQSTKTVATYPVVGEWTF